MFKSVVIMAMLLGTLATYAQKPLDHLLKAHNTNAVPYITVQELAMPKTKAIVLDARELAEYKVSHLKDAIHVGFNTFNIDTVSKTLTDKNQAIVVYCSLGIRSEDVASQLKKAGYTNVQNLYGGIFEWKNNNFDVYNAEEKVTDSVHAFSKAWGKWLLNGTKVYQ